MPSHVRGTVVLRPTFKSIQEALKNKEFEDYFKANQELVIWGGILHITLFSYSDIDYNKLVAIRDQVTVAIKQTNPDGF